MKEIQNSLYTLIHITSKKNFDKISKYKKINSSKHDIVNNKIQWLGDGIYFWDSNDDEAIILGKNLVKGKFKNKELIGIIVNVEIEREKHMNLENINWYQKYTSFIKSINPNQYEKIINYMEIIRQQEKVSTEDLNKIGILTGTTINLFLKHLLEDYQMKIDMVSGYFYHGKKNIFPFRRNEKTIRQFCVKNEYIVNNMIDEWKFKTL